MGTAEDVLVGASGVIYGAAAATPLPTSAIDSLNGGFKDLGFVGDAGVTQSVGQNTNEIVAWGGSTVRKVQTSHTVEFKFVLLETNPDSAAAYYKEANISGAVIEITKDMNTRQAWVIDVLDGDNIIRLVIPDGEVTAHDDVVYKTGEVVGYGMTITAYEDASGVKAYKYLDTAAIS